MIYLGGKKRIARHIAQYINLYNPIITDYYEPFCGMCSVGRLVYADNKYFSDVFEPVIVFWEAIKEGWLPDDVLSPEQYNKIKKAMDYDDPLTAFAGFGCSFGGKWFGGYAKSKRGENYVLEASNYVKEARNFVLKVRSFALEARSFTVEDYVNIKPVNSYVYLDPPYFNTTHLPHLSNTFNYNEFYDYCELLKGYGNKVFISEYAMPTSRFDCVLEIPIKCTVHTGHKQGVERIEKLFVVKK